MQAGGGDVDYLALTLDLAIKDQEAGAQNDAALLFVEAWSDHQIGDAGLVFDSDEHHPLGAAGLLAHQHQAGDTG